MDVASKLAEGDEVSKVKETQCKEIEMTLVSEENFMELKASQTRRS